MKKRLLLCALLCFVSLLVFAQEASEEKPKETKRHILFGAESGGTVLRGKDPVTEEKIKFTNLRFGPYLGYYLSKNWIVGITGEYEFVKSTYTEAPSLYGWGFFVRYQLPFHIKKVKFLDDRLRFISEASFLKINYYPQENQEVATFDELTESVFRGNLGITFRLWKQLHLEKSIRSDYFIDRKFRISHRLGFEYHY